MKKKIQEPELEYLPGEYFLVGLASGSPPKLRVEALSSFNGEEQNEINFDVGF